MPQLEGSLRHALLARAATDGSCRPASAALARLRMCVRDRCAAGARRRRASEWRCERGEHGKGQMMNMNAGLSGQPMNAGRCESAAAQRASTCCDTWPACATAAGRSVTARGSVVPGGAAALGRCAGAAAARRRCCEGAAVGGTGRRIQLTAGSPAGKPSSTTAQGCQQGLLQWD
jgi:hypothetical protein